MEGTTAPSIGHNNPPTVFDTLKERVDKLVTTANRWATERPEIKDAEIAARCDDFLNQITGELKKVEEQRKAEKAPHLAAAAAVDTKFNPLKALLETIKSVLGPRMTAWLRAEQKRRDDERAAAEAEALRKLQEAEDAQKAAQTGTGDVIGNMVRATEAETAANQAMKAIEQIPERAQVKGAYSPRARTLRTTWHARVTDLDKAFQHYRGNHDVTELLERLASADARAASGKIAIPGCEVYDRQSAA